MSKIEEGKAPCFRVVSPYGMEPSKANLFVVSRNDGFYRALICASAAVGAQFLINNVFVISLTDRFNRTFIFTGPTGNALIRNHISHFLSPHFTVFNNPGLNRPAWSRHGKDFLNLRHFFLQELLNPHLQGHLGHGAPSASPCQSYFHHAIVGNLNQFNITAVGLKIGSDLIDRVLYSVFHIAPLPFRKVFFETPTESFWVAAKHPHHGNPSAPIQRRMTLHRKFRSD
jgi:hypothetical protein